MYESIKDNFAFNFKFKLHKSLLPIGIDDEDYDTLQVAYGIDHKTLMDTVEEDARHIETYAGKLLESMDLSALKTKPVKIEFLGDSITSDRRSYMNIIRKAVSDMKNVTICDYSISAHKSTDLFTALYVDYIAEHADIAHIMIGTNDFRSMDDELGLCHTSAGEFEKNLDYIVRELTRDGTKVILTTLSPVCMEKVEKTFAGSKMQFREEDRLIFNLIIEKVVSKYGARVNKMDDLYLQYPAADITLDDGLHLNEIGHALLTERVMKAILDLLGMM